MATTYRTVSEEMAWTNWSAPEQATRRPETVQNKPSLLSIAAAVAAGVAMLAGAIYLLPPGIH